jgi:hypothetical protein
MSVTLFVLDVDDFRPLAKVAAKLPDVEVVKRGPYYEVSSDGPIEIDRDATGCRNAVWFSSVAAVRDGHVSRWDKTVMSVLPGSSDRESRSPTDLPAADLERDVV